MIKNSGKPMKKLPSIAVDVMGSDYGPWHFIKSISIIREDLEGAVDKLYLIGDKSTIDRLLVQNDLKNFDKIVVIHAPEFVKMDDNPLYAIKNKKEASMFKAVEFVKTKQADLMLSCGNTGSLVGYSILKLGTIEGIERPSLTTIVPTFTSPFILLDVGANPVNGVNYLVHNAILGAHYAASMFHNVKKPKVGLLTIGTEDGKGTSSVNSAHEILKKIRSSYLDYVGLIEGFDLFSAKTRVVVCDGFTGNVLIKTLESLYSNSSEFLKKEFKKNIINKLGAFLCKGIFKNVKAKLKLEKSTCAPLLGVNGWIFKAHGASKYNELSKALKTCIECVTNYNLQESKNDILKANKIIESLNNANS